MAPEYPCPAAVEDAVSAYSWLLDHGIESNNVVLAGGSAGGGLAMAALLSIKAGGIRPPAGAALLAPWLDLRLTGESIRSKRVVDFILTESDLRESVLAYAGDLDLHDPRVSPLYGDLSGLPPILAQVGESDLLLDDSVRLAALAVEAGIEVELDVWRDLPHVFQAFAGLLDEADAAITKVGGWIRRACSRQEEQ